MAERAAPVTHVRLPSAIAPAGGRQRHGDRRPRPRAQATLAGRGRAPRRGSSPPYRRVGGRLVPHGSRRRLPRSSRPATVATWPTTSETAGGSGVSTTSTAAGATAPSTWLTWWGTTGRGRRPAPPGRPLSTPSPCRRRSGRAAPPPAGCGPCSGAALFWDSGAATTRPPRRAPSSRALPRGAAAAPARRSAARRWETARQVASRRAGSAPTGCARSPHRGRRTGRPPPAAPGRARASAPRSRCTCPPESRTQRGPTTVPSPRSRIATPGSSAVSRTALCESRSPVFHRLPPPRAILPRSVPRGRVEGVGRRTRAGVDRRAGLGQQGRGRAPAGGGSEQSPPGSASGSAARWWGGGAAAPAPRARPTARPSPPRRVSGTPAPGRRLTRPDA